MSVEIENAHMVKTERGGWTPDPPMDESWSDLVKLKWHAALVRSKTGINVTVHRQPQDHQGDYYQTTLRGTGWFIVTVHTYRNAWTYLNGVEAGAKAAQQLRRQSDL